MTQAIGVRLPDDVLKKIEEIGNEENEDRSTVIRKLLMRGYEDFQRQKAAEEYKKGKVTISEAARIADLTLWEMESFLVERGYKSQYSVDDLKRELELLEE